MEEIVSEERQLIRIARAAYDTVEDRWSEEVLQSRRMSSWLAGQRIRFQANQGQRASHEKSLSPMITLIVREFTVDAPARAAWDRLARLEQWPSWARHITRIDVKPPGELGPQSEGIIHLTNGMKSTFQMTEFRPHESWKWVGRFLWLTVYYDHRFVPLSATQTKLVWTVAAEGFGAPIFGRLFAKVYRRNLEKAIPLLVSEMTAARAIV